MVGTIGRIGQSMGRIGLSSPSMGGGVPAVISAMRASVQEAQAGNLETNPPMKAPPAWAADFGWLVGDVVANDSGKLYICTANPTLQTPTLTANASGTSATLTANWSGASGDYHATFSDGQARVVTMTNGATSMTWTGALTGTPNNRATIVGKSASSGGPTGLGTGIVGGGPITDGALTWYYYKPQTVFSDDPDAPTVTWQTTTPSGYSTRKLPITDAALFRYSGGQPYVSGTERLRFPSVATFPGPGNATSNSGGLPADYRSAKTPCIEFYTSEQVVPINGLDPQFANERYRIAINDQWLHEGAVMSRRLVNPSFMVLTFPTPPAAPNRIRIYPPSNVTFQGVMVNGTGVIAAPTATPIRMTVIGTSMTAGANTFSTIPNDDWPSITGRQLGNQVLITNAALGGTGFISNNSGTNQNMQSVDRIADVVNSAPDVLLIENHNDDSYTSAARKAAYIAWLGTIRTALPNCLIIMFGQDCERQPASTSFLAVEADLLDVFNTLGGSTPAAPNRNPLLHYKPIMNDPGGIWHTGTGFVTAQTGVGNNDYHTSNDGLHPVNLGIRYRAGKYYTGVLQVLGLA